LLSVNRKFSDEVFFQRVVKRRYSLLVRFKRESETWRRFYLRMITYIAKLQEKYDIPYIHSPDFDPENFYKNYQGDIRADALYYDVKGKDKNEI
jgi:hypothetical protein